MRNTLKFLFYSALVLFVGVPVAFVIFVLGMSLFGVVINDDAAEWTFRLFDHPGVYIFRRQ